MAQSKYSGYELETIISYNRIDKTANVYTADSYVMSKLDKLVEKYPDEYKCIKDTGDSKEYEFPKKLIQFRSPRKMTEAQIKAATERLNKYNNSKK